MCHYFFSFGHLNLKLGGSYADLVYNIDYKNTCIVRNVTNKTLGRRDKEAKKSNVDIAS